MEASYAVLPGPRKLKVVDRDQFQMPMVDVDTPVPEGHEVRAIWELTGKLDLRGFPTGVRSEVGRAGREHSDPRLPVAIWLYAYSEGISSAGEVSRHMEREPGLRWLAGLEVINHTTLSEFRTAHRDAARRRVARQRAEALERAVVELEEIRKANRTAEEQTEARGSITGPEARPMRHGNDGGIAPSYKAPVATDAQAKTIGAADVDRCDGDAAVSLAEVVREVEVRMDRKPGQLVADGGYTRLEKVKTETLWACPTYNVMQWIRLVWRKGPAVMPPACQQAAAQRGAKRPPEGR